MKSKTIGLVSILAILTVSFPSTAREREVTIVQSEFQVPPGQNVCSSVQVSSSGHIAGSASAFGGSNNDIRVLVVKDQRIILHDSGRRRSIVLNVPVSEPGTYFVCFDNRFSMLSRKTVWADIKLVQKEPERKGEGLATGFAAGLGALSALAEILEGRPVDQAIARGLNAADSIFSDINWARLRGYQRTLRNWRVVNDRGVGDQADIEVVFVNDLNEVDKWCRSVLQALFKEPPHPAWGCTRPGPPWRIVAVDPRIRPQTIAHEIWHTKGYWGHVRLSNGETWPADARTRQAAPFRVPRPDE